MQNFLLNIFITMVLCSIWLQLRARQDFLGSTLLSGPIKEEETCYLCSRLKFEKFVPSTPALFLPSQPYVWEKKWFTECNNKTYFNVQQENQVHYISCLSLHLQEKSKTITASTLPQFKLQFRALQNNN